MTTKELYRKHKSGDVSNQKFLYEVRRDAKLPWITNMTSYEDAVKILKNKGIINEADGKKYGEVEVIAKTVDMVNPYEYANGLDYELGQSMVPVRCDLTEDEVLAAQKKVLDNLTKDPNYYTKVMHGLKPKDPILGPREIEVTDKTIEAVKKGPVKADGYIKKELKKDVKANVKDNLGDSEKAPKKPKGVEELKDKGVTGSVKTIKEGIEEIIREKLAQKKANENKVEEAVGNFELKKLARELYSVIKKVNGVTGVKIVTSDIKNAASAFQAVSKKGNTYAEDAVMAEIFVNEANSFISIILSGTSRVLNPVANEVNKQLQAFVGKNYADQLDAQYVKAPNDNTMLGINVKFKNNPSGVKESKPVEEHHNDPNFPGGTKIHALLTKVAEDWGKEDLYNDLEDAIVGWSDRYGELSPKGILAIKSLLANWDVLDDYQEFLPEVKQEESAVQKMKEALKAALKTEKLDSAALKAAVEKGTTLNISKSNASDISAAKNAKANFTTYE